MRKDGSRFMANVVITAVSDGSGKLVGFAKVTRDVTERHRADAALKLANRELEAFSYSVAHDLRAPLRGMNGFAQVLLIVYKDKLDAEGQDWLQEILSNARKMGDLIDALLSLARVARSEIRPEPVDLSAVARAAAAEIAAGDPGRTVDVLIQADLAAEVDARLARTIFDNLLGNAWKFTRGTSVARVEVGITGDWWCPCVLRARQRGGFRHGIKGQAVLAFSTAPHRRRVSGDRRRPLDRAANRPAPSRSGSGSQRLTWAKARPSISLYRESGADMSKAILLVEDNASDEKLTLLAFKSSGIANDVVVERDGAAALDYLFATGVHQKRDGSVLPAVDPAFDLGQLPRIDGLEVLRRIRADERTRLIPVVVLTSSKQEEDIVRSYSLGANAYVRKPVDFTEFATAAKTLGLFWLLLNEAAPAGHRPA